MIVNLAHTSSAGIQQGGRVTPRRIKFILTMDFHGCPWMSRGTSPWMSMDIHVLLNGIMVKDHGLSKHGLVHGFPRVVHVLLNGIMVKDDGL